MNDTLFDTARAAARLIPLPKIYHRLRNLLEQPDYAMADVAVLISHDPAMTTYFLKLVNSPYNRRRHRIETVSHAVSMLGVRQIHDLVLNASVFKALEETRVPRADLARFWEYSVRCAMTARLMASECRFPDPNPLFTCGLLHAIGQMIMMDVFPQQATRAKEEALSEGQPLFQAERRILGFDYANLGACLMEDWHLPDRLITVTRFHVEPEKTPAYPRETALIFFISQSVSTAIAQRSFDGWADAVHPSLWQTAGITPEQCITLEKEAGKQIQETGYHTFLS